MSELVERLRSFGGMARDAADDLERLKTVCTELKADRDRLAARVKELEGSLNRCQRRKAELENTVSFICEAHDAGRHDGLPEPCPAHDADTMFAAAREVMGLETP